MTDSVKRKVLRLRAERVSNDEMGEQKEFILDKEHFLEYFNVNCGHEFFPTVNVEFIHFFNEQPGYIYIPAVAAMMTALSYCPFAILQKLSDKYLRTT